MPSARRALASVLASLGIIAMAACSSSQLPGSASPCPPPSPTLAAPLPTASPAPTPSAPSSTPAPSPTAPAGPASLIYTVAPGDSLTSIAARFGTTWQSLVYWNRARFPGLNPTSAGYNPNHLAVGWQLTLQPGVQVAWVPPPPSPRPSATATLEPLRLSGPPISVPILYLHIVRPIPADIGSWSSTDRQAYLAYMITPCEFSADLDWLATHGYHTVLPRDLAAHWDLGRPLPSRPIILTFDDGTPDWVTTVLPLLKAHHMVAEFYVTVGRIGTYLTWSDLAHLRDAGMGIGAHDMTHVQLVVGGREIVSVATMRYQVTEAKRVLESHLGIQVDSMAYVGGGYDTTLVQLVREAGYLTARAIVRGIVQSPSLRFQLRVSRPAVYDDVVGKTLANAIDCVLDPSMSDFQARVTGTNPS